MFRLFPYGSSRMDALADKHKLAYYGLRNNNNIVLFNNVFQNNMSGGPKH